MNVYVTGDAEKLIADSEVLILVPATVQQVLIEERVLKRDFLMDAVAGLLKQDPEYTAEEIAEKMLLDKELIENIIAREKAVKGAEDEPAFKTSYIVYNQLTKTTYGANPEENELILVAECKEGVEGDIKWKLKSTYDYAYALPCKFEYNCLSKSGSLKSNAVRAVKDAVSENDAEETVIRNASLLKAEENCYILTGIKWNKSGRLLSFDNWSVFSPVECEGKRENDMGLFLNITENFNGAFKGLHTVMREKFGRKAALEKLSVVEKNADLDALCRSKNIILSEALKPRILERQRALYDRTMNKETSVIMKLYSAMEWELFEILNELSKTRREKIRDTYKHETRKPEFVGHLFETAGLDYRDGFFNDYFSTVNDGNITNILIKYQAEPSFGVMFICLLINNYIEAEAGNEYEPVRRLKEICSGFMTEFDLLDFRQARNLEKHGGVNSDSFGAMLLLCGKLDKALFGVDFITELGAQTSGKGRKKIPLGKDVLEYTGLKSEDDISALQSLLNNYASEDSQMYNDCERLLISVIAQYVTFPPVYADREERNGKVADALKKVGISLNPEWDFLKSTVGSVKLLPQWFCDLIICDGKKPQTPFLKILAADYRIFGFIDEMSGKIGHTNSMFNLKEAGLILEQVEEFIHIIKNL